MNKFISVKFLIRVVVVLSAVFIVGSLALLVALGPRYGVYLLPPSPQQYAKDAIAYMDYGLYASEDAWAAKREEALLKAESLGSYEEAHALLEDAVKVAGGKHSAVVPAPTSGSKSLEAPMTTFELDENGILHLTVPSAEMGVQNNYFNGPVAFMKIHQTEIKGAIVDLRGNTGGDMGPMIGAVAPLLPDGTLLEFHTPAWDYTAPVTLAEGVSSGGGSTVQVDPIKLPDIPVAILQDEKTASSGEAVLLAFRGLPNTRTFGAPSAGYCSSNSMRQLYDGATILLTIGTDVARTGEEFCEDPIAPDVQSEQALDDALAWLLSEIG